MKPNKKLIKQMTTAAVLLFFISAGVWYLFHTGVLGQKQERTSELTGVLASVSTDSTAEPGNTEAQEQESKEELVVYVCGAVNVPGIYTLPAHSRLYEALAKAGGFSEEADPAYHNLARTIKDGERIYILSYAETRALTTVQQTAGEEGAKEHTSLINLNTATGEQLTSLPGIGEAKAAAILEYRSRVGQFAGIEEIMNVSGIGEAMFEKIKDKITVH